MVAGRFLFGEVGAREIVGRQHAGFGGHAEEATHAFNALLVEDVVNVLGEVGADGLLGERELARPVLHERIDLLKAVIAGADEIAHECLIERAARGDTPDGGDEGEAGERAPFFGEVVIEELFAGAFVAVSAFFEGHESGVADEDGGVGAIEHGIEVCSHRNKWHIGVSPFVKENAGVGDGGAACGVGCDTAQCCDGL